MTNGRGYFRALSLACIGLAIMGLAALCRCCFHPEVHLHITSMPTTQAVGELFK